MTIWKVGIRLRFSLSRKFIISNFAHPLTRAELEQAISNYGPILQLHPNEIYNNTSIEYFLQLVVYSEDYRDELGEDFLLTNVLNEWHRLSAILGNDAISARQGLIGGVERYSCHRTNNRRIKVDLIFEWRKERVYAREKQGFLQIAKRSGP
jgi:hypothetical protein